MTTTATAVGLGASSGATFDPGQVVDDKKQQRQGPAYDYDKQIRAPKLRLAVWIVELGYLGEKRTSRANITEVSMALHTERRPFIILVSPSVDAKFGAGHFDDEKDQQRQRLLGVLDQRRY